MIKNYNGHKPEIHQTCYVAQTALVLGKVKLAKDVSIWPGCVLRGDVEDIIIKEATNLQDGTIIHTNYGQPTIIGRNVTVGHGVILHGCQIGDNCLIGMGAILLDGVVVGDNCIVAAGAVVTEGTKITDGQMVLGIPARVKREVTEEDKVLIKNRAVEYIEFAKQHKRNEYY
jgi:carbonic anhydrase/acetyltransferase-like protein (isoleucine patch superfamily)